MLRSKAKANDLVALVLLGAAVVAVALFSAAAHVYPGGTHFDRLQPGHDFWRNSICDVARSRALSGAMNHGAILARGAMASASLGLGALFWLLAERFASRARISLWVRALGALVIPGGIAIALLPTDRFSAQHGYAIMMTGIPGLLAAMLATYALALDERRPRFISGIGFFAVSVSTVDFVIYAHEIIVGGPPRVAVSVLERIASLLVVAWMLAVATTSLKTSRREIVR